MPHSIDAARALLRQYHWHDAMVGFSEADRVAPLGPDDLVDYAAAAWWNGDIDAATNALERAYGGYELDGRRGDAAMVALRLARIAMFAVAPSVMAGWIARAQRLLVDEPESAAHAWLAVMTALVTAFGHGDFVQAEIAADDALILARKHDSPDAESLALAAKGQIELRQGRWREGLALVEEAAAAATSERAEPKNSCDVYCLTIAALSDLGEYGRAGEWIDQADRWMRLRSISGYRGLCRVHRAELKRLRGDWQEAEKEALEACGELERFRMLDSIGFAHYQIGEVRLRLGDFERAAEAFQRAVENGHSGQPGLALLALAQDRQGEATDMIAGSLSPAVTPVIANDLITRSSLLAAQVEVALAGGDVATAQRAAEELGKIDAQYSCEVLSGLAATAAGAVALRKGKLETASAALRGAMRHWKQGRVPYEWARARALLGQVLLAAGDRANARLELRAARGEFERLGAVPDIGVVDDHLRQLEQAAMPRKVTRTFMFTDIVSSTHLAGRLGDDAWGSVMAWHDRTLRAAFDEHGGVEVRHTGDGFFVTFDDAAEALRCAAEIQRRLEHNRLEHGSALSVRIGLHLATALPHERDYAGHGVHVAARVAALAGSSEILATSALLEESSPHGFELSEPRPVELKGVDEPVIVRSVAWR